ncbi:MAG: hypothetical protein F6K19_08430 [Cyanothece sp. SIO1E1]|nr:hypothetical protein [Cyanothece sp. SIO1E1]
MRPTTFIDNDTTKSAASLTLQFIILCQLTAATDSSLPIACCNNLVYINPFNYQARGRHKSETVLPNLVADIRSLVDGQAQADPKFQSPFLYTRISARAVREALVAEMGYEEAKLPSRQTIGEILNRLGYRLKKLKKPSP